MKEDLQCDALHVQYRKVRQLGELYKKHILQYGLHSEPSQKAGEEFKNEKESLLEKIAERKELLPNMFLFPEKYGPQVERYEDEPETYIENLITVRLHDNSRPDTDFSILRNGTIISATDMRELALWSQDDQGHWGKKTLRDRIDRGTKVIGLANGDAIFYGEIGLPEQAPQYIRQNGEVIPFTPKNDAQKDLFTGTREVAPEFMQRAITPTRTGVIINILKNMLDQGNTVHCTPNQEDGTWDIDTLLTNDDSERDFVRMLYQESGDAIGIAENDSVFLIPKQKNGKYEKLTHLKDALPNLDLGQANDCALTNDGDLVVTDHRSNNITSYSKALVYKKKGVGWENSPDTAVGWEDEPETTINDIGDLFEKSEIKGVTKVSNDTLIFEVLDAKEENLMTDYQHRYLEVYYKNDTGWEKGQLLHGHSPKLDQDGNVLFISDGDLKILRPKTITEEKK